MYNNNNLGIDIFSSTFYQNIVKIPIGTSINLILNIPDSSLVTLYDFNMTIEYSPVITTVAPFVPVKPNINILIGNTSPTLTPISKTLAPSTLSKSVLTAVVSIISFSFVFLLMLFLI